MTTPNDGTRAWRGCYSKKKYATEALAQQVAGHWMAKNPKEARYTYHCQLCGCWHITKQRRAA